MKVTRRLSLSPEEPSPADLEKLRFHEMDFKAQNNIAIFIEDCWNSCTFHLTATDKKRPEIVDGFKNATKLLQGTILGSLRVFPGLLELQALQFGFVNVSDLDIVDSINVTAVPKPIALPDVNLGTDLMSEALVQRLAKLYYVSCKKHGDMSVDDRFVLWFFVSLKTGVVMLVRFKWPSGLSRVHELEWAWFQIFWAGRFFTRHKMLWMNYGAAAFSELQVAKNRLVAPLGNIV